MTHIIRHTPTTRPYDELDALMPVVLGGPSLRRRAPRHASRRPVIRQRMTAPSTLSDNRNLSLPR